MTNLGQVDWNTGDVSRHVSIGPHKLYVEASGPDRRPGEPVVLLMTGLGSTLDEWVVVKRLVTAFARWVSYDRSGLGRSEGPDPAPDSITAESVAAELDALLKKTSIEPPYVIVCHSWGGLTSRELLHLRPNDIAGMIFVDCNNERSWDDGQWNLGVLAPLLIGQDWIKTVGLDKDRVLSDAEWELVNAVQNKSRHQKTEAAEAKGSKTDQARMAGKRQLDNQALGRRPVSVISASTKDLQLMFDAGVAAGNGSEDERATCRDCLARIRTNYKEWQMATLKLSSTNHFVEVECAHNVQMLQPQVIVDEISWALAHVERS